MPTRTLDYTEAEFLAARTTLTITRLYREKRLTERQYYAWVCTYHPKFGWSPMRIAQYLRISLRSAERALSEARALLGEVMEGEGKFEVTIAHGHEAKTEEDVTPDEVAYRLERARYRRGRVPVG